MVAFETDEPPGVAVATENQLYRPPAASVLERLAFDRVANAPGATKGGILPVENIEEYTWKMRTNAARQSQLKFYLQFCNEYGRSPMPILESHMVAYITTMCEYILHAYPDNHAIYHCQDTLGVHCETQEDIRGVNLPIH